MIQGNENIAPGSIVEGQDYQGSGEKKGIFLHYDATDESVLIAHPIEDESGNWDANWLAGGTVIDISDSAEGRELREAFPSSPLAPNYIFMVIRPKRQIETYANLDALLAGMVDAENPKASDHELRVHEAAALAIADPGTDIKIPPGASNSPWLRFQQVEGA